MESIVNPYAKESSFTTYARLERLETSRTRGDESKKNPERLGNAKDTENVENGRSTGATNEEQLERDENSAKPDTSWTTASPGKKKPKGHKITASNGTSDKTRESEQDRGNTATTAATDGQESESETSYMMKSMSPFTQKYKRMEQRRGNDRITEDEDDSVTSNSTNGRGHNMDFKPTTEEETTETSKNETTREETNEDNDAKSQVSEMREKEKKLRKSLVDRINEGKMEKNASKEVKGAHTTTDTKVSRMRQVNQQWKAKARANNKRIETYFAKKAADDALSEEDVEMILFEDEKEAGLEDRAKEMTFEDRCTAYRARQVQAKGLIMAGKGPEKEEERNRASTQEPTSEAVEKPGQRHRVQPPPPMRKPSQKISLGKSDENEEDSEERNDGSKMEDEQDSTSPVDKVTKDKKSFAVSQPMRKPSQFFFMNLKGKMKTMEHKAAK